MKVAKTILYLIMFVTCCLVISDYSYSHNDYDGIITFCLAIGILYWIYKFLKTLIDIMTDFEYESDYKDKRRVYKNFNKEYHREPPVNSDCRWCNNSTSCSYDNKKKKAEEIGNKIQIRKDIKIVEIVKKENSYGKQVTH